MQARYRVLLAVALGIAAFSTQVSATPVFTDWTAATLSEPAGSATGTLGGSTTVTFSGNVTGAVTDGTGTFFSNTSWFTPALPTSDFIKTTGGINQTNTITFSSAVMNPILHIASLGRNIGFGTGFFQNWTFTQSFTILSSLVGGSPGFSKLTNPSGNVLHGEEGHGSIQFAGAVTSIQWTSDIREDASFFQVGFDNSVVPAPEPTTLVLLALGLAGAGFKRRQTA